MKTPSGLEREFRYGMEWGTLLLIMLFFAALAGGFAWGAAVNTTAVRLYGLLRLAPAVVNAFLWVLAAIFAVQTLRLIYEGYRRLFHHDRIAFTATQLLLPAGKRGREIAVPYNSLRGVFLKKMENSEETLAIILKLPRGTFEIELSKLPSTSACQEILELLRDRVELPTPKAAIPSLVAAKIPQQEPRLIYQVVGLPVGGGQTRVVINTFDDLAKARECVRFLQLGGKYDWVDVEPLTATVDGSDALPEPIKSVDVTRQIAVGPNKLASPP